MQKQLLFFALLAAACILLATAFTSNPPAPPKCFNYQAVVRGSDGSMLKNQSIALRISFLPDSISTAAYSEKHSTTTDQFGMVSLQLGCGDLLSGSFEALDWRTHDYWVKIEIDPAGGNNFVPLSESKLLAVPYALYAENGGDWLVDGQDIYRLDGRVGIGILPPQATKIAIKGMNVGLPFEFGNILSLASSNSEGGIVFGKLNESGDSYIQSSKNGGPSRLHLNPEGGTSNSVTIKGSAIGLPFANGNILDLNVNGAQGGLTFGKLNSSGDSYIQSSRDGGTSTLYLNPESPHARVVVPILEITGGDVAEARHSATGEKLPAGSVVVFDETQQGKIRLTSKPYDKKVAGVISGAGRYFAGVCLLQEELAKGAMPLAQVGTVEVLCVGPVEVGDLLTTSEVEGHAMAVNDPLRGIGCTVGKAVGSLKAGERGLVEMQVEKH